MMCQHCNNVGNNISNLNVKMDETLRRSIYEKLDNPNRDSIPNLEETTALVTALLKKKVKNNYIIAHSAIYLYFNGCDDLRKK